MAIKRTKKNVTITYPKWLFGAIIATGAVAGGLGLLIWYQKTHQTSGYSSISLPKPFTHVNLGQAYSPQATPYTTNAPNVYAPAESANLTVQTSHRQWRNGEWEPIRGYETPPSAYQQKPPQTIDPPHLGWNPGAVNYYPQPSPDWFKEEPTYYSPLALPFQRDTAQVYYAPFSLDSRYGAGNPKTTGGLEWKAGGENEFGLRGRCKGGCKG